MRKAANVSSSGEEEMRAPLASREEGWLVSYSWRRKVRTFRTPRWWWRVVNPAIARLSIRRRPRRGLRWIEVWASILGVEGKGGGCMVLVVVVRKKEDIAGAVIMCRRGRRG